MRHVRFPAALMLLVATALIASGPGSVAGADNAFAPYEGVYRLPSGETIALFRAGVIEELAKPVFLDWQTGRYDSLVPAGPDRFQTAAAPAASGEGPSTPPRTEIAFGRGGDGRVESLTIREAGFPERRAFRDEICDDRETTFRSGDAVLAATLRLPKEHGPFPGIVLVHGSGPGERTQLSLMSNYFAGLGLAVLTYDKRGCGASGGDWKKVDLDILAQDALAGVRRLKEQPGIDPRRVGLWGISQGGWIAPLAGSLDGEVGFVMNMSGPATSLRRQDTYNMANTLKLSGFTEEEAAEFVAGLNVIYDFGRGRASAEAYDAVMDRARAHPKFKTFALPPAKELSAEALYARQKIGDPAWYFHMNPDNDALAPYRKLRCPVLVTYGRLDYSVPVEESAALLAALIAETESRNITVEVVPDAGHGYLRMQEADPRKPLVPQTISRAFFVAVETWLRANGIIAAAPSAPRSAF